MAKKIMQFRFYGENDSRNQPSDISAVTLKTGAIFTKYLPITQLGIQTLPGTKVYLNNALTPIYIGSTGVYELDLEGLTYITHLAFDEKSLQNIADKDKYPSAYLIVDAICEVEEGEGE